MTTYTKDTALALKKLRAVQAIREAGTQRTEITVAEFLAKFTKGGRTRGELERLCDWYINMGKSAEEHNHD